MWTAPTPASCCVTATRTGCRRRMSSTIVTAVAEALDYAHEPRPAAPRRQARQHHVGSPGVGRSANSVGGLRYRSTGSNDISGLTATQHDGRHVSYYAAPEQLMGDDLDGRADQYALAATRLSPADRLAAVSAFQSGGRHQPAPHRVTARDRRHSAPSCPRSIRCWPRRCRRTRRTVSTGAWTSRGRWPTDWGSSRRTTPSAPVPRCRVRGRPREASGTRTLAAAAGRHRSRDPGGAADRWRSRWR